MAFSWSAGNALKVGDSHARRLVIRSPLASRLPAAAGNAGHAGMDILELLESQPPLELFLRVDSTASAGVRGRDNESVYRALAQRQLSCAPPSVSIHA